MFLNKTKIEFPFVDIHTHILSGIDDGAKDIAASVQMVEIAYEEGIRKIVATPHYHPEKCMKKWDEIKSIHNEFVDVVQQLYPDVNVYEGREIYYTLDCLQNLNDFGMTINKTRYILVEFDFSFGSNEIRNAVYNIFNMGMIPIVAHIERYDRIIGQEDFVYELKEMGAVIQINASSFLGKAGKNQKKFVRELLSQELVDVVATDAHSAEKRAPYMKECIEKIAKRYGSDYAKKIAYSNPCKILDGAYIS